MEELRKRMKEVMFHLGKNINQVAQNNAAMQSKLSRQINRGATITGDVITHFINYFPQVSETWLMTGNGAMLKDGSVIDYLNVSETTFSQTKMAKTDNDTEMVMVPKSLIELMQQQIETKDKQINALLAALNN